MLCFSCVYCSGLACVPVFQVVIPLLLVFSVILKQVLRVMMGMAFFELPRQSKLSSLITEGEKLSFDEMDTTGRVLRE